MDVDSPALHNCGGLDFWLRQGLRKGRSGRVTEFDREKGTVTLIRDLKTDPGNPEYTQLPPVTYTLPKNYGDNGSEPKTGYRMKLDTKKSQIIIF